MGTLTAWFRIGQVFEHSWVIRVLPDQKCTYQHCQALHFRVPFTSLPYGNQFGLGQFGLPVWTQGHATKLLCHTLVDVSVNSRYSGQASLMSRLPILSAATQHAMLADPRLHLASYCETFSSIVANRCTKADDLFEYQALNKIIIIAFTRHVYVSTVNLEGDEGLLLPMISVHVQ